MSKKQIGSDYVQTDSKSRVKLHKSGKSWVKTTLTSMGLLHLFRGAKTEERVLDTDLDLEAGFSSTHWFKGAAALGALVGGAAVTNTAYAAETTSTLPVTSEVTTTGTTQVDSTVVASASVSDTTSASASTSASTSQSISESQSLLASASTSQSESLSTSQSTSTSTASTSGTSTVSTSTSSSQSTSTSDSAVLAPKANTLTSATTTLAATGTVNNNLVTVTSATLTDSDSSDGFLYPNNGETVEYKATFTVDNTATAGDQFTMVYSPYVVPSDFDMAAFTSFDITDTAGEVIATGTWDATTKTVTYTFTTYVDKYTNVVASIDAFAYVDRAKVPNNTTLPITYSFGGETISKTETITYQTPIVEGSSSIQSIYNELSSTNNTVEQIFYVNPMDYYAYSTTFDLYGYIPADVDGTVSQEGSTIISPSTTTIQVYNAGTGTTLPDSMKITDYSTLTQVSPSITYGTDSASIFLGDISDVYVIRVVTQFDPTSPDSINSAGVMSSDDSLENKYYVESDNNIVYSEDTSDGTGELTYSVGDYVWFDANQDGLQTTGESPVANVLVTLHFPDGTQKAVYTDANGHYQFDGLSDQTTYTITFTPPTGYVMTTSNAGTNDTIDSDGSSVTFTINGADNMTLDTGLVKVYTIGDTVWEDTNKDGIQDAGEPGIPGVTVTLTNPDGTTVTTTTDANGHYEFTDLPNGDYTVTFETPAGYVPTTTDTGDDSLDSDGQVVKVTVAGSDNPTIDSGFVKEVYTIGDTVWEDTNK
ncbi:accessory Sec-dependent serine-rich glycoprotein adhesin, partial [Streptococcus uberis]